MAPISGLRLQNGRQHMMLVAGVFAVALSCLVLLSYSKASVGRAVELLSGPPLSMTLSRSPTLKAGKPVVSKEALRRFLGDTPRAKTVLKPKAAVKKPAQITSSLAIQKAAVAPLKPQAFLRKAGEAMPKFKLEGKKVVCLAECDTEEEDMGPPVWHAWWFYSPHWSWQSNVPYWIWTSQANAETEFEGPISFRSDGDFAALNVPNMQDDHYSAIFYAEFCVQNGGKYTFTTESDDGSNLWIDWSTHEVWNDGLHGMQRRTGKSMYLKPGIHHVVVNFFENEGGAGLVVTYAGPDSNGGEVPLLPSNKAECKIGPAEDEAPAFKASYYFTHSWYNYMPPYESMGGPDFETTVTSLDFPNDASFNVNGYQGFPDDYFAAKYTGEFCIKLGGIYRFTLTSDDGSRMWVDDWKVVDDDGLHGPQERNGEIYLAPGLHKFKVDFFENGGGAMLSVKYAGTDTIGQDADLVPSNVELCAAELLPPDAPPPPSFLGHWYFLDQDMSTMPVVGHLHANIETNVEKIEYATPAEFQGEFGDFFPTDHFAGVFTGYICLENAGTYTFSTESDDGSQLFLDSKRIVNNDGIHEMKEAATQMYVKAGQHAVVVKYFQNEGDGALAVKYAGSDTNGVAELIKPASANASLCVPAVESTVGILAKFYYHPLPIHELPDYETSDLVPMFEKVIENINFASAADFSGGYEGFPARGWSVDFTANICILKMGTYKFYTKSSDGSKIYIDGVRIVDNGGEHPTKEVSRSQFMREGMHKFEAKYFMNGESEGDPTFIVTYKGEDTGNAEVPVVAAKECNPPPPDFDEEGDTGPATPLEAGLINGDNQPLLNTHCANIREVLAGTSAGRDEMWQKHEMAKCMAQDCEQAMETREGSYHGCRFMDSYGFCYAYVSAQHYCAEHMEDQENCIDNAGEAALPPLGIWDGLPWKNEWHPIENAEIKMPKDPKVDGTTYACTCMKNCGCEGKKGCWCSDPEQQPVGYDEEGFKDTPVYQSNKQGKCSCECGGVYSDYM